MLAMEMATGKSRVGVEWFLQGGTKRGLIVAPAKVVPVWPDQFERWAPGRAKVVLLRGSAREQAAQVLGEKDDAIFVTNYEMTWREPFRTAVLEKAHLDSVAFDESHRIKSPSSKVSRMAALWPRRVKRRLCLTGTPAPNSRLDLYGQFRFMDPSVFGTNYAAFCGRYAVFGGFQNRQLLFYRKDTEAEMREKFESLSYRVRLDDVLDLPPYVDAAYRFKLGPLAKRVYDELEKESISEITEGGATVVTGNVLSRLLRLQQITSGFVPDDTGKMHHVDKGKIELFQSILEDLPEHEPVVVFCVFHNDLDEIARVTREMGRVYGELSGRRDDVQGPIFPEGVDVLGVQIQSGKEGIDLTRSKYAVFYSLGQSLGDYQQASARLRRPGQTRPVARIHLLADKSVDERILRAINRKQEFIRALIDPGA